MLNYEYLNFKCEPLNLEPRRGDIVEKRIGWLRRTLRVSAFALPTTGRLAMTELGDDECNST